MADPGRTFVVIGAGGLGGPLAYALAAAGARRLVVVDPDVVELSNLQRQIQFTTADLGRSKVLALGAELVRRGHPAAVYRGIGARFHRDSAATILDDVAGGDAVVCDASDDPATKFWTNDAARARGLPAVIGGVHRYRGQVHAMAPGGACYRCLFEDPPVDAPSCADAGVLGATVAVIAGAMAHAALELAAGRDGGGSLVWDDVRDRSPPRRVRFHRRPDCPACRPASAG